MFKNILWTCVAGIVVLYFAVPAALLRWNLDRLIFTAQSNDRTHEDRRFDVVVSPEATVVVRGYGDAGRACAFFFGYPDPSVGSGVTGCRRFRFKNRILVWGGFRLC